MIKMKCIGNEIKDVQYYGSGKAYGCADEHHNWLEIGKVYEITQITGQMSYDNNTGKTMNGFLECVSKNYNNVISTAAVRGIQGFGATATYPIQNPYFSGVNGLSGGNIGSCSDLIKGSTRIDGGSTLSTGKVTVYSCITSSEKLTTTIQVD